MGIRLNRTTEMLIEHSLEQGIYRDADELVAAAIIALEERIQLESLRAAISEGDVDIARGNVLRWTDTSMDDLMREINGGVTPS